MSLPHLMAVFLWIKTSTSLHLKRRFCIGIIDFVTKVLTPCNDYYVCTGQLGQSQLSRATANCEILHCAACEYAKAKHHPTATKTHIQVPSKSFALKCNKLYPGQMVSMDHINVTDCGRLYTSMGKPIQM